MNMKTILITILLLTGWTQTFARQHENLLEKVNIGDKVPDYILRNMINYPDSTVNLMHFKGKILVLDFWSTVCSACLASWPKLIKLQEKFKDQIQIITVNPTENSEKIRASISRQEKIHQYQMTLPVAIGDRQLMKLFPHHSLPHVILIDQNQTVRYITNGYNVNEQTIQNMLDGKQMGFYEKTDSHEMNYAKPLFINGNFGPNNTTGSNIMLSTVITPYLPDVRSIGSVLASKKQNIALGFLGNFALKDMFRILYGKRGDLRFAVHDARVAFKNLDSSKYVMTLDGIIRQENRYTIQLIAKKYVPLEDIKKKMIADLELWFGLKTGWERQKKTCVVISRNSNPLPIIQSGKLVGGQQVGNTWFNVNYITMEELIDEIGSNIAWFKKGPYPIVDETGFKGILGAIRFYPNKVIVYQTLKELLAEHGLNLSIQEREVDVLVISK